MSKCVSQDRITIFVRNRKDLCERFERVRDVLERLWGREVKNVELLDYLLKLAEKELREELRRRAIESY